MTVAVPACRGVYSNADRPPHGSSQKNGSNVNVQQSQQQQGSSKVDAIFVQRNSNPADPTNNASPMADKTSAD